LIRVLCEISDQGDARSSADFDSGGRARDPFNVPGPRAVALVLFRAHDCAHLLLALPLVTQGRSTHIGKGGNAERHVDDWAPNLSVAKRLGAYPDI